MSRVDPITEVYRAIWGSLAGYKPWMDLFARVNLISFDGQSSPMRWERTAAQVPEAALFQGGFSLLPFNYNAIACSITHAYPLVLTAASLDVVPVNLLKWHTLRALIVAGPQLGLPYVVSATVRDAKDGQMGADAGQIQRWTTVLTIVVEMAIDRREAIAWG